MDKTWLVKRVRILNTIVMENELIGLSILFMVLVMGLICKIEKQTREDKKWLKNARQ